MKYYPMHMHLHCSHEPTASIGSHMAHAKALGIEHLWLTEHDVRMGRKKRELPIFRLNEKKLFCQMENGVRAGFKKMPENTGMHGFFDNGDGKYGLLLSADHGEYEKMHFYAKGKNHCDPLFSRVTVALEAELALLGDSEIYVEMVLSAQPPSFEHAKLVYCLGKLPNEPADNVRYLPMPRKTDGAYIFDVTKDADDSVGGLDNAVCYINLVCVGNSGRAEIRFSSFRFTRELEFEEVRQEQMRVAETVGRKWGVTPFVTFEISDAGHHKNCYDTRVPVMNYEEHGYVITQDEAIAHVISHGGIFCYNHPFTEWKNEELTDEQRDGIVDRLISEFTANRVFGATLMEVGFPYEKENFFDKHYLRLWDGLSSNGIFITGDGDSDNHHATNDGWTEGNNFATYAGIPDGLLPNEENIRRAFVTGNAYTGDPVKIGDIAFSADGADMGSIIVGRDAEIHFSADGIKTSGIACLIVNGERTAECKIENGHASFDAVLPCKQRFNFARVELRDGDGVLIALTNPIYSVTSESDVYSEAKIRIRK